MKPWREEDHPRDEIGRFTEKDDLFFPQNTPYAEILRRERELHRIPLDYFGLTEDRYADWADMPTEVYGFLNKKRLYTHDHIQHAQEMHFRNSYEYESAAVAFWNSGDGDVYITAKSKYFYKYNSRTNEFISVDGNGVIHTYMLLPMKNFLTKLQYERLKKHD